MLQGEHSAILSTLIKLSFVAKVFVMSIFEWPFYCIVNLVGTFIYIIMEKLEGLFTTCSLWRYRVLLISSFGLGKQGV